MFQNLKSSRSLLMGLAIAGIVFFHAPYYFSNQWLAMIHDNLCCGVDLFLFYSGLGACHSIGARGGEGYLRQRAKRIFPSLLPVLFLWSFLMVALGLMNWREFFGSVTLLGWWVGSYNQLNWYFSAVWLFFLLAVPLYGLFRRTKHPVLLWLGLAALTLIPQVLISHWQVSMLLSRMLVFLTGMLFGRLEQTGFSHENRLRAILFPLMLLGLLGVVLVTRYWSDYGYSLGLWYDAYALMIPGGAVLLSDLAARLRQYRWFRGLEKPIAAMGQASSEILIVHMAVYKVIFGVTRLSGRWWLLVMLGCLAGGVAYQKLTDRIKSFFRNERDRKRRTDQPENAKISG